VHPVGDGFGFAHGAYLPDSSQPTGHLRLFGAEFRVLDGGSEPQPDLALVRRPWRGYPHTHLEPDDIFLLIEVADSSLDFDRTVKRELYARAGILDVWIVDLTTDLVLVHRRPSGGGYGLVVRVEAPGVLGVEGLPGMVIPLRRSSHRIGVRCG